MTVHFLHDRYSAAPFDLAEFYSWRSTIAPSILSHVRGGITMCRFLLLLCLGLGLNCVDSAQGATIFESGTLGPTGLAQGSVPATNISPDVFTGVRFQLSQPVVITQVGGHFVDRGNGTFFGAIVALDDENDFPNSGDLSTSDVLGNTELTFSVPSDEVFGNLTLSLDPGWYALVFGSGLFDAIGGGAAPRNNSDIGNPSYISFQPGSAFGWINRTVAVNHRFVVKGNIVPEPSTFVFGAFGSLCLLSRRRS